MWRRQRLGDDTCLGSDLAQAITQPAAAGLRRIPAGRVLLGNVGSRKLVCELRCHLGTRRAVGKSDDVAQADALGREALAQLLEGFCLALRGGIGRDHLEMRQDVQGDAIRSYDLKLCLEKGRIRMGFSEKRILAAEGQSQIGELELRRSREIWRSANDEEDRKHREDRRHRDDHPAVLEHRADHPTKVDLIERTCCRRAGIAVGRARLDTLM